MTVALARFSTDGIAENEDYIIIGDLNSAYFQSSDCDGGKSVLINEAVYTVYDVAFGVKLKALDEPIDVVKLRRKPN